MTYVKFYYNPITISSYHAIEIIKNYKRLDSPDYNKTFPFSLVSATVLVKHKHTFNKVKHLGLHVF